MRPVHRTSPLVLALLLTLLSVVLVTTARPAAAAAPPPGSGRARPAERSRPTHRPRPTYRPPVDRPVVDPFRAPAHRYGPGNRGLEYATVPGDLVRAIGDGVVVYAGRIAGARYVTVRHPDGLRSSYSYLAEILVRTGTLVRAGTPVGRTGARLHLGVRRGDDYVDPATLFRRRGRPVLVPGPGRTRAWSRPAR